MNPFKKFDTSDFEGVYQPLGESQRKSSIVSASAPKKTSLDDKELEDGEKGGAGYAPNTIESLRAEIDADIAASGHDSVYDRMFSRGPGVESPPVDGIAVSPLLPLSIPKGNDF